MKTEAITTIIIMLFLISLSGGICTVSCHPETCDIAVTNILLPRTVLASGHSMFINVTLENVGDAEGIFDVTLYVNRTLDPSNNPDSNSTLVDTATNIHLENGTSTKVPFIWNTTGFALGNYTISANATILASDPDPSNNVLVNGTVVISIFGDVNGDYTVDIQDLQLVKNATPSWSEEPRGDPNADINNDEVVDVLDIQKVKRNIPKHYHP